MVHGGRENKGLVGDILDIAMRYAQTVESRLQLDKQLE